MSNFYDLSANLKTDWNLLTHEFPCRYMVFNTVDLHIVNTFVEKHSNLVDEKNEHLLIP